MLVVVSVALLVASDSHSSIFGVASASGNTADAIRIDANASGNTATSLGKIQTCREVSTGDTFDVDVVIENVTNLLAFKTVFVYDKSKLKVVDTDIEFLVASGPGSSLWNTSASVPDSDGYYSLRALDVTHEPDGAESGSGVLGRVTLEAIDSGLSTVFVSIPRISPGLVDFQRDPLEPADRLGAWLGDVFAARIAIDEECPGGETAPPPTPPIATVLPQVLTPVPGETGGPAGDETPTAGQTPQSQIEGNTADAIRIDAHPTGNTATSLGSIEFCRDVQPGDSFDVDIVIENVTKLLGFAATFTYEENKLHVVDSDVQFLLSSQRASDLLDNSERVPDEDGLYELNALDRSPAVAAAESGSGVLARLTLEAQETGLTTISIAIPNITPSLTDVEGNPLQPADEFGVWLGDMFDAQIAIGESCPETPPQPSPTPSPEATVTPAADGGEDEGGGRDLTVVWAIVGALGGVAALLAAFVTWRRLRGQA